MKYRIEFSVPDLSDDCLHSIEMTGNVEDMWKDVHLAGEIWDLNVWQDDGPIQAGLYPVSVDEKGKRTTDTTEYKVVFLHSVRRVNAVGQLKDELIGRWKQ